MVKEGGEGLLEQLVKALVHVQDTGLKAQVTLPLTDVYVLWTEALVHTSRARVSILRFLSTKQASK